MASCKGIVSAIFLCSIIVFGTTLQAFSSEAVLSEKKEESPLKIEGAETVSAETAKRLFDERVVFIDVRKDSDWEAGRIPGAVHIELKNHFSREALLDVVQKDAPVVFYCNGSFCMRSSQATALAVEWGFEKVYYFRGGFPAWQKSNYPVE